MGRNISLFSAYKQDENRETNYTLLVLRLIYEESPTALANVLASLISEDLAEHVGVKFQQQRRKDSSVPDGEIRQDGFLLYVESKRNGPFDRNQLTKHLESLRKESTSIKVLLAISAEEDESTFTEMRIRCGGADETRVDFLGTTYADLLEVMDAQDLPRSIKSVIGEYREFLQSQDLLPDWETRLDVVNCATSWDKVANGLAYICPAEGGAYSHKRSRYFGVYRNKSVELVAEIEGVVDVEAPGESRVVWKNVKSSDNELKAVATERHAKLNGEFPRRVFVLGPGHKTHFVKDSKGGMLQSKKYFDVSTAGAHDAKELAEQLNDKVWSQLA